jgi:hypothetical protein
MKPELTFDHFYVVLTHDHYTAIKSDPVWKQFFANSYEDTVRTGEGHEWTGHYSMAINHRYLELFYEGPRSDSGYVNGAAGIGLCSEEIGATPKVKTYFETIASSQLLSIVPRTLSSKKLGYDIPWFTFLSPPMLTEPFLKTWAMDYSKEYIDLAKVEMRDATHFMRDKFGLRDIDVRADVSQVKCIRSITVACLASEVEAYKIALLGFTFIEAQANVYSIGDFRIYIKVVDQVSMRVLETEFELTQPIASLEHRLHEGSALNGEGLRLIWKMAL